MDITVDANLVFSETTVKIPDPVNDTDGVNKRSLVSKIGEYISINTLGANITQGATITSITLSNPASKHEYESGNTVRIIKKDTGEYQDFVVSDDIASGSTLLSINSDTANYNFNVGDYIYVILNDITSAANSGNGFDELFIIDNTLNYWLYVQDVVLKTSDTVGDGATAGVVFDEFGIRNYTSSSTTPTIDINSDGSLSQLYVNISDKGTAASPAIRFSGDADTGIFSSGDDTLDLVTGGLSRLTIDASGNLNIPGTATIGNINLSGVLTGGSAGFTGQVLGSPFLAGTNGSAGAPVYTRDGDTDTGMYFPTLDEVAFSTTGTERLKITSTEITLGLKTVFPALGDAIQVQGDADTYMGFTGLNTIYLTCGGTTAATFADTYISFNRNLNVNNDVYLLAGKLTWYDSGGLPPLNYLQLYNNELYFNDGTYISPLAMKDWVNNDGRKAFCVNIKNVGEFWVDGENIFVWRAPSWANGKSLTGVEIGVYIADANNDWNVTVIPTSTSGGIVSTLSAGSTRTTSSINTPISTDDIFKLVLSRATGTSGAPEGLTVTMFIQ